MDPHRSDPTAGREPATGPGTPIDPRTKTGARPVNRGWYALLLIPFVALLWPRFYARNDPEFAGIPFFYWYQFLWVLIGAVITALVYRLTTTRAPRDAAGDRPGARRTGGAQ